MSVGTVLERDDGSVFVISYQYPLYSDPEVVRGHPNQPDDPIVARGAGGSVRVIGTDPMTTMRALASIASIERVDGRSAAVVRSPGDLSDILQAVASTDHGEAALVDELIKRAEVYGKKATYGGDAVMHSGHATVYLRWDGEPERVSQKLGFKSASPEFAHLTSGEWSHIPVGAVLERADGTVYVVYGLRGVFGDPDVILGNPNVPHDPTTAWGGDEKFRIVGTDPMTTIRAMASIATVERVNGRSAAAIRAPGALSAILQTTASTPDGEAALVAEIIKRAKVYGKVATYHGDAVMHDGHATVYLRWEGEPEHLSRKLPFRS